MPFEALFVPDAIRDAVSDRAWLEAMVEAERALAVAAARAGVIPEVDDEVFSLVGLDADELAREGRRVGNPAEPLARALRSRSEHVHHGATSQDVLDTAAALVVRDARALILAEVDRLAAACAQLAEEHRDTVMAGRTLLQQATPTTFGLKAAGWLTALVDTRVVIAKADVPAQLGGAAGTLAAFGERALEVRRLFAAELGLSEPVVTWHTIRVPLAIIGARLGILAGAVEKIALDVLLLAQTEVGEVRVPAGGGSSTMPHKRNPVAPTLARACAAHARAAAGVLVASLPQEHERAAGAWHAEWKAVSDVLAYSGGAVAWTAVTLEGLEVDGERMRANLRAETLSEAERFGGADRPEDYLGAAGRLVDRALELYRG